MINEFGVIEAVCSFLEEKDYVIVKKKKSTPHSGDDIIAKKEDRRLYVDVYGETSTIRGTPNHGNPFSDSQQKVHVTEALYACAEVLSRRKVPELEYKVAMAFADTVYYRKYVANIQGFLDEIKIAVFFVDIGSNVDCICNWEL